MIKEFFNNPLFYVIILAFCLGVNGALVFSIYKVTKHISQKYPVPTVYADPVTGCGSVSQCGTNKSKETAK